MFHQISEAIQPDLTDFGLLGSTPLTSRFNNLTHSRILGGGYLNKSWYRKLSYISFLPHLAMVNSHLTVLESSASAYASATLFRTPQLDSASGQIKEWRSISYRQFYTDVELFARYWTSVFTNAQIPRRSIIGLWWVLIIIPWCCNADIRQGWVASLTLMSSISTESRGQVTSHNCSVLDFPILRLFANFYNELVLEP